MIALLPKLPFLFLICASSLAYAQFNFFEQMFGGGGHAEHHQPQDVPSDSAWYRKQWQEGMLP